MHMHVSASESTATRAATAPGSKRLRWIALAAVLVLLAILIPHWMQSATPIHTATAERADLIDNLSTNGNVEPMSDFVAHSPVAGVVKSVLVHEGERVRKDQLLLTMDDAAAQAQVASALAALRTAQAQMDAVQQGGTRDEQLQLQAKINAARAQRDHAETLLNSLTQLAQNGSASQSEVTAAKTRLAIDTATLQNLEQQQTQRYAPIDRQRAAADLSNAQAAYQAAQDTLQQENVRAPFEGTVFSVPVQASAYVQPGDALLRMANLALIQIRAYFDEPEIGRLALGQPVTIVWDARPGRIWHGHITQVPSTIITYGTRHVGEALIAVDDADGVLLPNTNVTLTVTTLRLNSVLTIPREALHAEGGQDFVYRIVDGRLVRTPIQIGVLNLTQVQVLSGLEEHAVVALSATDGSTLRNGLQVQSTP
jgi:HlyD family secretion protein